MAIRLGTNFDLKSKQFLDSRQGLSETKNDLKNWSTPVPPGFEVCLEEEWYYYDPEINLSETGHWVPRLVGKEELEGEGTIINGENRGVTADAVKKIIDERLADIQNQIDDQGTEIYPTKISNVWLGEGNGRKLSPYSVEVGTLVNFSRINVSQDDPLKGVITYEITKKGVSTPLVPNSSDPNSGKFFIQEDSYILTNTNGIPKSGTKAWTISDSTLGVTYEAEAKITWNWKNYWGIFLGNPANLSRGNTPDDPINLPDGSFYSLGSAWTFDSTFSENSFDCSNSNFGNHRHPIILIPATYFPQNQSINLYVQGISYSDITIKYINYTMNSGRSAIYAAVIINQTQSGDNIRIRIDK